MAKKILVVSAVLGFVLAGLAFSSGQKDWTAPGTTGQKLVLSGTVSFQNFMHPLLKSGDKVYELLVPPFLVYQSGVKEGARVSVEGYPAQGMPRWSGSSDDGNIDVFVTKATIDGKDYDLSQFRGQMMSGPGFGRGYGPGYGPRHGSGYGPGYGRGRGMMGGPWAGGPGDGPGNDGDRGGYCGGWQ